MVGPALRLVNERLGLRAFVWAGLLAGLGVFLCFVPLFDVLGYDFAFAVGLVTAFAAADIGHGAVAAGRRGGSASRPPAQTPRLGRLLATGLAGALGALLLPLLASLANGLRIKNCSFASGLAFYLLLPVGTALVAAPAGTLAGWCLRRGGRALALLLPVGSLLWALIRLYVDPAVFAFDPFGGYFPGPIYDEAMRPPARLLQFRLANLLWIGTAVAVVWTWSSLRRPDARLSLRRVWGTIALVLVMASASLVVFLRRGELGFHVTGARLAEVLSRETRSPRFVLRTDPRAGDSEETLALVMRDLEFRYDQLRRILGAEPEGPVTVYLFPSAAAKKDLVGAGGTLYAKPWTREIFIQSDRVPSRRLRHELAHVFAGAFGDPVFGVSLAWRLPFPRLASGLVEGIAEAADYGDPDGRSTVHQQARAMIAAGLAPPLPQVVGAGFTTLSGARAYTIAGSFTHYLLQAQGPERLRAVYRSGGDFAGVYGAPLAALETRWRAFLETQPLEARERARAEEQFRRPAIFKKVCARDLAARVQSARDQLYTFPDQAVAVLDSVCQDDPHEPTYRLDLADAHVAAGAPDKALALATAVEGDRTVTRPVRARAAGLVANVHFHRGVFSQASAAVARGLELATDDGEQRTALARQRALRDAEARRTLGRVLFGDGPARGTDPAVMIHLIETFGRLFPDEALGPYLLGRQLAFRDPALALDPLEQACPLTDADARAVPLEPVFLRECHRLVGETAFRAGDLERSRAAFTRIEAGAATEAERLRARDFLERLAWEASRQPDRGAR